MRCGAVNCDADVADVIGMVVLGCVVVWGMVVVDIMMSTMIVLVV